MFKLLLNSDTIKTNGAMKPCHSPSQKPASPGCAPGMAWDVFAPGAHAVRTLNRRISTTRISTSGIGEVLIEMPPNVVYGRGERKVSKIHEIAWLAPIEGPLSRYPGVYPRGAAVWRILENS